MPYGYIYKITNTKNNKIYIGQTTKTVSERLNKHIQEARCEANGTRPPNYFHSAILKYGEDAFITEEIDTAKDANELNEKEIYWIDYYQATDKSIGYNLMTGGRSGLKSDETKAKIGEKKKENWQDEELAKRMRAGLEKATQTWVQICKDNRIECVCENCGKVLLLPPWEAEKRRYCSQECAHNDVSKRPPVLELIEKINELKNNISAVGRYYGVTDNAVRKWCSLYKI